MKEITEEDLEDMMDILNKTMPVIIVVEKFVEMGKRVANKDFDMLSLCMLIETVNNKCPLDFELLMSFSDIDFVHDICGMIAHFDPEKGILEGCFLPRCAKIEPIPEGALN